MNRLFLLPCFILAALQLPGQPRKCHIPKAGEISVVIFLAVDCPISQKYIPVLTSIHEKYKNSHVTLQSFVPGNASRRTVNTFRQEFEIPFYVNRDSEYECVKALAANVTPEVFVFDSSGDLRYRGAIDNWFYDLGEYRKEATEHYLTDAIDALISEEKPATVNTHAVGCPIQVPGKHTTREGTHH